MVSRTRHAIFHVSLLMTPHSDHVRGRHPIGLEQLIHLRDLVAYEMLLKLLKRVHEDSACLIELTQEYPQALNERSWNTTRSG